MAKEYKVGERYYLPVTISSIAPGYQYPIELLFVDCDGRDTTDAVRIADEPELLLTAEDIATVINTERDDALEELKSRNAELEALLKEVMATRDEAIRQNNELIAENKKLKDGADKLKDTLVDRTKDVQHLTEENAKLKTDLDQRNKDFDAMKKDRDTLLEENANLKAWYEEANKTASEAAEANDELKAKIADLRNRVGEQLAQIQDLNAEVHFLKEKSGKQTEEANKPVHVVTNDGTDIAFNRNAEIMYRTDVDMFVVNDGDKTVAGFLRGDKPGNLAYFWTE